MLFICVFIFWAVMEIVIIILRRSTIDGNTKNNQCLILSSSEGEMRLLMHLTMKIGTHETATMRATFQAKSKSICPVLR